jgi:hypothetical protein
MNSYDPTVTSLAGQPLAPTPAHRAQAAWLLRKYTSLTYLRRLSGVLASFVSGYAALARSARARADHHGENLAAFDAYGSLVAQGTDLLERGYTIGYASILQGCVFAEYIGGRRFDSGGTGNEPLFAWAALAMKMCLAVSRTLRGRWAFPGILMPPFVTLPLPADLPLQPPMAAGGRVRTGEGVPTPGIWRPVDISDGCPNYLWAGRQAPAAERASERLDYPARPGDGTLEPPRTTFTYVQVKTTWELLWEDRRYTVERAPETRRNNLRVLSLL